jgi:hypothetical protein
MRKEELLDELRRLSPADRYELMAQFPDDLNPGGRPRVFVSYSRDDSLFVNDLITGLERGGVFVWFDVRELAIGEDYLAATEKGLRECDFCIVVISPYSMKSTEVARELDVASAVGAVILPVILQDAAITDLVRNLQWVDFRFQFEAPLAVLVARLHGRQDVQLTAQRLRSARRPLLGSGYVALFQKSAPLSVHFVNVLLLVSALALCIATAGFARTEIAVPSCLLLVFVVAMIRTTFRIANRQATRLELRLDLAAYLLVPFMPAMLLTLVQPAARPAIIWAVSLCALSLLAAILITEFSRSFSRRLRARLERLQVLPSWLRRRKPVHAQPASS